MANKKTFEERVEDAQKFVDNGEIKKAISTLKKAIENNPKKDIDKKIETWIAELEKKPEEKVEEKVPETIVDPTDDIKEEDETEVIVTKISDTKENEDEIVEEKIEKVIEPEPEEVVIQEGMVAVFTKNPKGVCLMGTLLVPGEVREFKESWKDSLSTIPDIKIIED